MLPLQSLTTALNSSFLQLNLPLDKRRGSPFDPPLEVENARWRSTPGMTTDVNSPCPLQNSKTDCATFAGVSARTSPARSIFSIVTFSLSVSLCNFSTTLAYGESIPVISRMSTLQFFNGKSLRLRWGRKSKNIAKLSHSEGNFSLNSRHERLHVMLDILTVKRAVKTTLKVGYNLLLIRIIPDQLLMGFVEGFHDTCCCLYESKEGKKE